MIRDMIDLRQASGASGYLRNLIYAFYDIFSIVVNIICVPCVPCRLSLWNLVSEWARSARARL